MNIVEKALQHMEKGKADKALALVESMLVKATEDETFEIADFYLSWGYYDEAATLFEKLLKDYEAKGQLIVKLAEIYIELEEDERAVQLLNQVQRDDDFYLDALLYLGDLYQDRKST